MAEQSDMHPVLRLFALEESGASEAEVTEVVLELLRSDDPESVKAGVSRARELDDPRVLAALAELQDHPDAEIRSAAGDVR